MFVSRLESADLKTQVANEIMRYIHSMDLKTENKLPREETFCKILGTSRVTLRAALDELASRGVIFRRHGKGTFVNVCSLDIKVSFNPVMDFYDMITFSGFEPGMDLIDRYSAPAPDEVAQQMHIKPGQNVLVTKKVFYADQKFCAFIVDYLNLGCMGNMEHLQGLSFDQPIFPLLDREFGVRVEWDRVEIDVALSSEIPQLSEMIRQGSCKDGPLLLLKGMNYDADDRPVLYGMEYIDTSLIKFNQIRKRSLSVLAK